MVCRFLMISSREEAEEEEEEEVEMEVVWMKEAWHSLVEQEPAVISPSAAR